MACSNLRFRSWSVPEDVNERIFHWLGCRFVVTGTKGTRNHVGVGIVLKDP